jgi:hypothetical protein
MSARVDSKPTTTPKQNEEGKETTGAPPLSNPPPEKVSETIINETTVGIV